MPTPPSPEVLERDVVVVGAGPAGLMAARRLQAAGRSVVVLEALSGIAARRNPPAHDPAGPLLQRFSQPRTS